MWVYELTRWLACNLLRFFFGFVDSLVNRLLCIHPTAESRVQPGEDGERDGGQMSHLEQNDQRTVFKLSSVSSIDR